LGLNNPPAAAGGILVNITCVETLAVQFALLPLPGTEEDRRVGATFKLWASEEAAQTVQFALRLPDPASSSNMRQPIWNFEQEPTDEQLDETGVNLRAYFDRMDDEKMRRYDPTWSDEQVVEWDGNFRDDGNLMMFCCERDVEVDEYRRVMEECIEYRNRVRDKLPG